MKKSVGFEVSFVAVKRIWTVCPFHAFSRPAVVRIQVAPAFLFESVVEIHARVIRPFDDDLPPELRHLDPERVRMFNLNADPWRVRHRYLLVGRSRVPRCLS